MGARKLCARSPTWASSVATLDFAAGLAHEGAPPAMLKPFRRAAVRVVSLSERGTWPNCGNLPATHPHGCGPAWEAWRLAMSVTQPPAAAIRLITSCISTSNEVPASPCCRSALAERFGTARAVQHCACGNTSSPRLKSSAWTLTTNPLSTRNASAPIRAAKSTQICCAASPRNIVI